MNKRIEELAEQATRKYDRLGFEIPFAQPDLEKFAELIVQSIANIDFRFEIGLTSDQVFAIRNLIKNHFEDEQ